MNSTVGGTSSSSFIKENLALRYFAVSAELVFMVLIVFGNTLVVMAVLKEKQFQTITHWYLFNLAISDLLMGAVVAPMDVFIPLTTKEHLTSETMINFFYVICVAKYCLSFMSIAVGGFTVVSIAVVRLILVLKPTIRQYARFRMINALNVTVIWLLAVTEAVVYVSNGRIDHGKRTDCILIVVNEEWLNKAFFSQPLVFGIVAGIAYATIVVKLRMRPLNIRQINQDKDKRLTYIVFAVVALFLLSWTPSMAYVLAATTINIDIFKATASMIYGNSFVNPVVYWMTMKEGREFVKRLLGSCCGRNNSIAPSNGSASTPADQPAPPPVPE